MSLCDRYQALRGLGPWRASMADVRSIATSLVSAPATGSCSPGVTLVDGVQWTCLSKKHSAKAAWELLGCVLGALRKHHRALSTCPSLEAAAPGVEHILRSLEAGVAEMVHVAMGGEADSMLPVVAAHLVSLDESVAEGVLAALARSKDVIGAAERLIVSAASDCSVAIAAAEPAAAALTVVRLIGSAPAAVVCLADMASRSEAADGSPVVGLEALAAAGYSRAAVAVVAGVASLEDPESIGPAPAAASAVSELAADVKRAGLGRVGRLVLDSGALGSADDHVFLRCWDLAEAYGQLCIASGCGGRFGRLRGRAFRLRKFSAGDDAFAKHMLKMASGLALLQSIDLSHTGFGDQGAIDLTDHVVSKPGCLSGLRTLNLAFASVKTSGMLALVQRGLGKPGCLASLEVLVLRGNGLGLESCRALAAHVLGDPRCLPALRTLDLGDNEFGEAGTRALVEMALGRPGCLSMLETLDLSRARMDDDGVTKLAVDALGKPGCLPSLRVLDLSANCISAAGATVLAKDGLGNPAVLQALELLDLSDNELGEAGFEALAKHALSKPGCLPSLTELDLSSSFGKDRGLSHLVNHALSKPGCLPLLQKLNLARSEIEGSGVRKLAEDVLGKPSCLPCLKWLDLSFNLVGDPGIAALVEHALGKPGCLRSLQRLDLCASGMGDEGASLLVECVLEAPACIPSIMKLHADSNSISRGQMQRLREVVAQTPANKRRVETWTQPPNAYGWVGRPLTPSQRVVGLWRRASKKQRRSMPWRDRQRSKELRGDALRQNVTVRVCDALLVRGDWEQAASVLAVIGKDSTGWNAATASTLSRHGRMSTREAGKVALRDVGGDAGPTGASVLALLAEAKL